MTFKEMQKILSEQLDIVHLADIARELSVTPQVINNWKNRDKVPYKYVKIIRAIEKENASGEDINDDNINLLKSLWKMNSDSSLSLDDTNIKDDIKNIILFVYSIVSKNYKFILLFNSVIVSFTIIYVLYIAPVVFHSTVSIIPYKGGNNNKISGIASQFGVNLGASSDTDIGSANLIPDLISSQTLQFAMLDRKFKTSKNSQKITLLEHYYGENDDFLNNKSFYKKKGVEELNSKISVVKNQSNDLMKITVKADESKLAADIAMAVVEELDKIQRRITLSRVKEKLSYISDRMENISLELIKEEEKLRDFRQSNRNIAGSPSLLLAENRIIREVGSLNQIYTTLKSQYEITRIEEIGRSTLIQVIDKAQVPIYKSSPKRRRSVLLAGILSLSLSLLIIYLRNFYLEMFSNYDSLK